MEVRKQEIFSFTKKSMERLFNSYNRRLVAYASKLVGSPVVGCDIVQDVFLKLWEKKPEVAVDTIKSYLFIQTRNTCISHLRHEKIFNNQMLSLDTLETEKLYAIDFQEERDNIRVFEKVLSDVLKFIDSLPPQTRNVFRLSRIDNLSHQVIASKLGVSEKAVEKHITIALKRFSFFKKGFTTESLEKGTENNRKQMV